MDQIKESHLIEHCKQIAVQTIRDGVTDFFNAHIHVVPLIRIFYKAILLPLKVIFLFGSDGAVAQALTIVARHAELYSGKEGLDEHFTLIGQVLTDAIGNGNGTFSVRLPQRQYRSDK